MSAEKSAATSPDSKEVGSAKLNLKVGAPQAGQVPLDKHQQVCVDTILGRNAKESKPAAIVVGNPGAGRTTVMLRLAAHAHEREQRTLVMVPDRLRADILQPQVEGLLPGVVRPVRTAVALAYEVVANYEVKRGHQRPELLTGAQEDLMLAQLISEGAVEWPEKYQETIVTESFRTQVRALMGRALEAGVDGVKLQEYGRQLQRPLWVSIGQLMQVWEDQFTTGSPTHPALFNSSQMQVRAASLIRADAAIAVDVLVVDDLQDMTAAALDMMEALFTRGVKIWVSANPDIAVSSYRGGEPHLHGLFKEKTDAEVLVLGPTHRGNLGLQRVVAAATNRLPGGGQSQRRKLGAADPNESTEKLSLGVYATASQEATAVTQRVAKLVLSGACQPHEIAVLARTQAEVERMRVAFMRVEMETTTRGRAINYAADQVAKPLLSALKAGTDGSDCDSERFNALLAGAVASVDPLQLQRTVEVVSSLAAQTQVDELLTPWQVADFLATEEAGEAKLWERLRGDHLEQTAKKLLQLRQFLVLGGQLQIQPPGKAIWDLWQVLDVQEQWRQEALRPGSRGQVNDARLDTVISLLRTADVWQQRNPRGIASQFAAELLAQTLPTDTLAVQGQRPPGVHILTVSQAIGRQWKAVFVVGVNHGQWPSIGIQNGITQAQDLTDLAMGRADFELLATPSYSYHSARKSHLDNELRIFAAALSRSREYLHVSGVNDGAEILPSPFLQMLAPPTDTPTDELGMIPVSSVPAGGDSRNLIVHLRRQACQTLPDGDTLTRSQAVELLALLARLGVDSADPRGWSFYRQHQDGDAKENAASVAGSGAKPWLSPSRIERLLKCPLSVFLAANSGAGKTTDSLNIGNFIHHLGELYPQGTNAQLMEAFEAHKEVLGFDPQTTIGARALGSVREQLACLASVFDSCDADEVATEVEIKSDVGAAIIYGFIDRLEFTEEGVVVADIKTGRASSYTSGLAEKDLQLRLYQYALGYPDGIYRPERVNLDDSQQSAASHEQEKKEYPVLGARWIATQRPSGNQPEMVKLWGNDEALEEVERFVDTAANLMQGSTFEAIPGSHCRQCDFKASCPSIKDGERLLP
ncbi:MAG: PD-(D/E)XK nuclease family protein [Actinomycetaceae bacterium]|nr:PD-(D/E)XK nuclease family protein [Actinomycetaceae bacterium]